MKYKRIDENTMAIYISERDIYDSDLNISQLFTADQKVAHDVIYNLLKKVDPDGDFFDSGQLSIQMMPKNKGLVINVQKVELDENMSEEEFLKATNDRTIQVIDDMKSLMKVVDELVADQEKEDAKRREERIAYILAKTDNFENIIQLAKLGHNFHTAEQFIYYQNHVYYVLMKFPKGMTDNYVNEDFMVVSEWLDFESEAFNKVLENAELVMRDKDSYTVMEQLQQNF